MSELATAWERRRAAPTSRFLELEESSLDLIAFAVEGTMMNWFALLIAIPLKSRYLVLAKNDVYLVKVGRWRISTLKSITWAGQRSEIRITKRGRHLSVIDVGAHRLLLPSYFRERLDHLLQ